MLKAVARAIETPGVDSLSFEERFGACCDRETTERDDNALGSRRVRPGSSTTLLRRHRLRQPTRAGQGFDPPSEQRFDGLRDGA